MSTYITRQIEERLKALFSLFPIIIISGARQIGKTTLLKHLFKDIADYVVFDPTIDVENARQDPDLFLDNHNEPLILDEIQYAPEVVNALKRRVDEARHPGRFLLTGSQQWSVLRNISESLAGRAVIVEMSGFGLNEICQMEHCRTPWLETWLNAPDNYFQQAQKGHQLPYNLYEYLYRGSLPEATQLPLETIRLYLQSYQQTYIERDVRLMASLSDEQLFGRFFQLASSLTAQEINHSKFGHKIGITPATASKWLAIMHSTFQWYEIPPYHGNATKRISGKRKGYISDTGVACMAQAISGPSALGGHPFLGALFETAVVNDVIRQTHIMAAPPNIYHWRSHSGAEVDLLLECDGCFFPIEMKVKSNPCKNDTRGISAFRKTYPHIKIGPGLVICCCKQSFPLNDNDYAVPWNMA
jgi:predicted AAA+ superfamily ATPase